MEYPGFFVPQLPTATQTRNTFHYPITPPYTHPYDTPPSNTRSAFTAVKSSSSGRTDYKSVELLHSLYANNFSTNGSAFFPPSPFLPPLTSYPPSPPAHNSPTSPKPSSTMIEHLLRRPRSPGYVNHHEKLLNDDDLRDDEDVICVDDDTVDQHMDRQRQDMVQRTSVIKSVIEADDRTYLMQEQRMLNPLMMRSAMQRMSSDSCGASSTSSASTDEDIVCKWSSCFRPFDTLMQLATHVTHTHAIASPAGLYYCQWHSCPRADRGFNARYKMLVHVRTHTKEKPHRCQQCDKSFSRAENLKIHTRSHSGEKPYVCPVDGCTKAYSNSSDRFKHTRTHSTEKPYLCKVDGCNKRYTDPSSLRKHVKTFKHSISPTTFDDIVKPYRLSADEMVDLSPPESSSYHSAGYGSGFSSPTSASIHRLDHMMNEVNLRQRHSPTSYTSPASYEPAAESSVHHEAYVEAQTQSPIITSALDTTIPTQYQPQSDEIPLDLSVQRQATFVQ